MQFSGIPKTAEAEAFKNGAENHLGLETATDLVSESRYFQDDGVLVFELDWQPL